MPVSYTHLDVYKRQILDCLNRTENAMSQRHAFLAAELSLRAAKQAVRIQ